MENDKTIIVPQLVDVLNQLKTAVFRDMNCVQIGKINSFDKDKQTASIELMIRRVVKNETKEYPILLDCPVFVLSGSSAYITMPITQGDECIILFNDRDIDNWFSTGNKLNPNSKRSHSLSDGIAIVGIRSLQNSISGYDLSNIVLKYKSTTIKIGDILDINGSGDISGALNVGGTVSGGSLEAGDGATGTFKSADPIPKTITVVKGIITDITP